jgi:hypothetical protein
VFGTSAAPQTDTISELPGQGVDSLNFSSVGAADAVTANLASSTTSLATHTNRTVVVASGGQAANFENATGGAGADALTGNNADNTLIGNGGADTLTGGLGSNVLNGGAGSDILVEARDTDFILTNSSLTATDGGSSALTSIETAQLAGGTGGNSFTIGAWTGLGSLTGGGGSDRVVAARNANFLLSNSSLSIGSDVWSLSGISIAELTGGSGGNNFIVSGWTGSGSIVGAAGTDTVTAAKDTNFTLSDASLAASDGLLLTLNSIESTDLSGGNGANAFDLRAWSGSASLAG